MKSRLQFVKVMRSAPAAGGVRLFALALWGIALISACRNPPPPPPAAEAPPPLEVERERPREQGAGEAGRYFYTPIGKRDPFRPFYMDIQAQRGSRPVAGELERARTVLEQFEIEQMKLVAIISGISTPRAMVELPNGRGYIIKPGTPIGRHNGRVARISSDQVVVEEEFLDAEANHQVNRLYLYMRKETPTEE